MTETAERIQPTMIRFAPDVELEVWPPIPAADLVEGAPVQRGQTWLDVPEHGLSAGIWECTAQTSTPFVQPSHEFMILLEGEVTIVEAIRQTTFRAGDAFVLPQGLRCQWAQPALVRKFWMTFEDPAFDMSDVTAAAELHALLVDPNATLERSTPPPAAILASEVPIQHALDVFTDPTGQFSVGLWDTTAYRRTLVPFDRWELMHILEGQVTMGDGSGHAESIVQGDTFIEPLGAPATWAGEGYLKKIYCLFRPAS